MRAYLPLLLGVCACNAITGMDGYQTVDSDASLDASDASDASDAPSDALTTCQQCLVQAGDCGSACSATLASCTGSPQKCSADYGQCTTTCTQTCNTCGTASTCTPSQCASAVGGGG